MAKREGFSPVPPGEKGPPPAEGPGSNTGQKGQAGALIDYLTLVVPRRAVEDSGLSKLPNLLATLFGFRGEVVNGAIQDKRWQFYERSAVLVDREGELVGRVGIGGNGDTICVSLSGAGCKWVRNWGTVRFEAERLGAKISRVDLAFDDYEGKVLNVHDLRARAQRGEFAEGGCPPRHRFLSDEGHGTGSTLYVGGKGHKELCCYEKGQQLGLPGSPWVRAEVRLYGKHVVIPHEVLVSPLQYLRGAYSVLRLLIKHSATTRLRTQRRQVACSAEAMVAWASRQVGPTLNVLHGAFGDSFADFLLARIVRDGHPGRFRGIAKGDRLNELVRIELCQSAA